MGASPRLSSAIIPQPTWTTTLQMRQVSRAKDESGFVLPPGRNPDNDAWRKLITYITALDYSTRFQFAHTGHDLVALLIAPRRPEVAIKLSSDETSKFRFRMDVSHRLNQFLQGAVGLRNHIGKILEVRATISTIDEEVTKRLNRLRGVHVSSGPIALTYALSNVFRHELVPGTIILETHYARLPVEAPTFEVRTLLGMGGLIGGEGWSKSAAKYANAHNPVELLPLAETYRREIRSLVGQIVNEVRGEVAQRNRT